MQFIEVGTLMAHQADITVQVTKELTSNQDFKVVVDVEATRGTKDVVGLKVVGMRDEVAEVLGEATWATTSNLISI